MGFFTKAEALLGKVGNTVNEAAATASKNAEGWGAKADAFLGDTLQKAADKVKSADVPREKYTEEPWREPVVPPAPAAAESPVEVPAGASAVLVEEVEVTEVIVVTAKPKPRSQRKAPAKDE